MEFHWLVLTNILNTWYHLAYNMTQLFLVNRKVVLYFINDSGSVPYERAVDEKICERKRILE